jgi:hypothetical protein
MNARILAVQLPAVAIASSQQQQLQLWHCGISGQCNKCQPDQLPFSLASCRLLLLLLLLCR